MLKISEIQIQHMSEECITDECPVIQFALESDKQGEVLKKAVISCNDWSLETTDQLNNRYEGEMKPFTRYPVHIKATGTSGETAEMDTYFETGRLDTPWQAKWITDLTMNFTKKESPRPLVFLKTFKAEKEVKRAWCCSTAFGVYELTLNGERVGNDYFAPGLTSYEHQIQYQTYDITKQLKADNTMIATVAGGWAVGPFAMGPYGKISADRPTLLMEIYVEYTDGTRDVIFTDTDWSVTQDSPYYLAEWYNGETYDATFLMENAVWRAAGTTVPRGNPKVLAQYGMAVRAHETMHPISHTTTPSGEVIYDFGQNFAGVIQIHVKNAKKGQELVFRHAEVIVDGELYVKCLRSAKATATYICKEGEQSYSPHFTYMGFRYVGVRGIEPKNLELSAVALYSDFRKTGEFSCSNEKINRLNENIRWGGVSNFIDIPTDCPQRDERLGWTGDIAVFASTACFNFDLSRFLDKWLRDVTAEQKPGGGIPVVIPQQGFNTPTWAMSCWGDCCTMVPWAEYLARGDVSLLERQYDTMKKFLKAAGWWSALFSVKKHKRYIWSLPLHLGDWCAPGGNIQDWAKRGKWVATAYYANSCGITANVAEILGKTEEAKYYRGLQEKITEAYRIEFTDGKGKLFNEFQTAYVLPLVFGMTEGEETKAMADHLDKMLKENDYKLSTGFPSTPYLLFALSDYGHLDTAYQVLLQEECPGWLYEVVTGGTTIWERWDALRPDGTVNISNLTGTKEDEGNGSMVSFNHYANGAVGDWFYRRIAGIESLEGGYRKFKIAPMPGGGLTDAKASILSPFGKISSAWILQDGNFTLEVEIPVSTECELTLPNGRKEVLTSGSYKFECQV